MFFQHDGHIISTVLPDALVAREDVSRWDGLAALTHKQCEALAYVQQTAEVYQLKTSTMAGDLTFVNNWAVVHGRESFEDSPEHSRYLVRMWLKNEHLAWTLPEPLRSAPLTTWYSMIKNCLRIGISTRVLTSNLRYMKSNLPSVEG